VLVLRNALSVRRRGTAQVGQETLPRGTSWKDAANEEALRKHSGFAVTRRRQATRFGELLQGDRTAGCRYYFAGGWRVARIVADYERPEEGRFAPVTAWSQQQ